jgi:alpha-1,3-glucan synthase
LERLINFSCLAIKALDFDAIRIDKSTQVTVDPMATWATGVRKCAADMGKTNFFISGEVTGGNTFGSLYM